MSSSSIDTVVDGDKGTNTYIVYIPCTGGPGHGLYAVIAEPDPWHCVVGQMSPCGDITWVHDYIVNTIGSSIMQQLEAQYELDEPFDADRYTAPDPSLLPRLEDL